MAYDRIKRNRYYDPPSEFPHSSRNHAEDLEEYLVPNQRMQNSNLHVWGIARGLEVSASPGDNQITVSPGIALDLDGRLISLSIDGHADVGSNPPGNQHAEINVPAVVSLTGFSSKKVYVTIEYSEILRPAEGSGGRLEVVPWIRLQPSVGAGAYVDNGASVILAIADINATGNLNTLTPDDGALAYKRRVIGQSIKELEIRRSINSANSIQETNSATLAPHTGGGLDITVAGSGDTIKMARDSGSRFSEFEINANYVLAKDGSGNNAMHFNSSSAFLTVGDNGNAGDLEVKDASGRSVLRFNGQNAWLRVGANGNEGDIIVQDGSGREAFAVNGSAASLEVGTAGNEGDIEVLDNNGNAAFKFDGQYAVLYLGTTNNEGDIRIRNNSNATTISMDGQSGNISNDGDIRADGLIRSNGNILGANPTRKVLYRSLFVNNSVRTDSYEIDIGYRTRFLAFTAIAGLDPLADHDARDAWTSEVYMIDGVRRGGWVSGGDHFGSSGSNANVRTPIVRSTGRKIEFRLRTFDNAAAWAFTVVMYE